ncbi:hypothetical protein GW17_00025272 [Ensete ventricosum]|nr:hypothetical protein GW17_00025272 [Ensete ventricosum]
MPGKTPKSSVEFRRFFFFWAPGETVNDRSIYPPVIYPGKTRDKDKGKVSLFCVVFGWRGRRQERVPIEEVFEQLKCTKDGLTSEEGTKRLQIFGPNKLEEKKVLFSCFFCNPFPFRTRSFDSLHWADCCDDSARQESKVLKFLGFMWNPLSWVMEMAAIMAIALANGGGQPPDWQDFVGIIVLLLINSTISFIEENNAGNAAAALMAGLAPKTKARDWSPIRNKVHSVIDKFAERGLRSLAVARQVSLLILASSVVPLLPHGTSFSVLQEVPEKSKDSAGRPWQFVGLLPLFDPPRHDSAETIRRALNLGVNVKMITGKSDQSLSFVCDQLAIAKETGRRLGMGTNMYPASYLLGQNKDESIAELPVDELIEKADGFAGVFPEHKYEIVKKLKERKHICGMTGDGVNDAPALKKADIGIAVSDATDAARSASDIVLTQPGLSVIISAVLTSRAIFQRMKNYTIAFTTKKDYGREEREAQWAMAQRTLHGLQTPENANLFSDKSSYRELSEIAEQAKRRAEVASY